MERMIELIKKSDKSLMNFLLVSFISSDTLNSVEDCELSIENLKKLIEAFEYIQNNNIETGFTENEISEFKESCESGISICERDKEEWLKRKV